jgi:hypothetical protein
MATAAVTEATLPAEVVALMKKYPSLSLNERGKVHCSLTKHDMPARVDAIQQHVKGTTFVKALHWYAADFTKYEPWIVPSIHSDKRLFCTLTRQEINKIPEEVEGHISTAKFRRLQEAAKAKAERRARKARGEAVESDEEDEEDALSDDAGSDRRGRSSVTRGLDEEFYEGLEKIDSDEEEEDEEEDDEEGEEEDDDGMGDAAPAKSGKASGQKRPREQHGKPSASAARPQKKAKTSAADDEHDEEGSSAPARGGNGQGPSHSHKHSHKRK